MNSQDDLRKQAIEEEFYELLENMMQELNHVKNPSVSREIQSAASIPSINRFKIYKLNKIKIQIIF